LAIFYFNARDFGNSYNECQMWVFICETPGVRDVWIGKKFLRGFSPFHEQDIRTQGSSTGFISM
jgi:hypothetical protein